MNPKGIIRVYQGPWTGVNVMVPPVSLKPGETPASQNVVLRGGRLTARPGLKVVINGTPDGAFYRGLFSFLDVNNVYHTCLSTEEHLYQLVNTAGIFSLSFVGNLFSSGFFIGDPQGVAILANVAYMTSLNLASIYSWDGTVTGVQTATSAYAGRYIFELASSIVIADTVESGQIFPQRVRWAVSGNPTQWDPNAFKGAGFNDLFDTPDEILGVLTIGTVAYIVRRNGLTLMTPTGVGTQPFNFNHLWSSEHGTGNVFPDTIASYGSVGAMLSTEDVFAVTVSNVQPIGGTAKYAIFDDIYSSNFLLNPPIGYMTSRGNYGSSLYQTYEIALSTGVTWAYSFDDKAWTRHLIPDLELTQKPNLVAVS